MQVYKNFTKSSKLHRNATKSCIVFAKMLIDIFDLAESCLLVVDRQRKNSKKGIEKNINKFQTI